MRPQNDRALPAAVASKHAKNEDLEVLRAVAIGFTILAHFPALLWYASEFPTNNRYFNFGSGVDLFFCISGFIITRSILQSRSRRPDSGPFGEFAFPFWIKRFFRLAPSAWLWIVVGMALSFPLDKTGFYAPFNVNFKEGLTALLQVANFEVAMCRPKNECGSLAIYWSLALEEQFYLIFPFLIAFCSRRLLAMIMLVVVAAQFFIPRPVTSPLWAFRTDAIALGVLIALWSRTPGYATMNPRILRHRLFAIPVLTILFAALATLGSKVLIGSVSTGLIAFVSAAIVWIASYDANYIKLPGLLKRILVAIGARSYVMYLTHYPALFCASAIWRALSHRFAMLDAANILPPILIFIVLTAAFTEFTHRIIEDPLRRRGIRIADAVRTRLAQRRMALSAN
ncbi:MULTISPECIES: acyltransferase [unclassified Caballeronia]|uniref:acyltransferase family protein n=1 Tax=unclassified Caballeronia TaxID=2646786 RepID=UPI002028FAEE|nr:MULTISPECIES: acyltransferase [unclassified Caballeronia]MDR5765966.1 acyltransferase [Caballeronia sp. LZ028]MDR5793737.1 acyltransferase [Caballeronia sp. LZ008]